ncbi:hypothetical protein O181_031069 [Austropuccinia psidii MF-1]|uniref:Uncharacterized protein n=1 Tax=Austropuccinia psidii MF-1 TaxID=1389203 RepID=A0A9Q3CU46_9BASI|nr:hypothetical protein [Austropuccinia psidii MF-1]
MEGTVPSRKEGRGTIISDFFSVVFGAFPGSSRTTLKGLGEDDAEEENSVEEKKYDNTEASPSPVGECEGTGGKPLAQYDLPGSHQTYLSLLAIMQQMTPIMAYLQEN